MDENRSQTKNVSRRSLARAAVGVAAVGAASDAKAATAGHVQYLRPETMFRPGTFSHLVEITGPVKLIYLAEIGRAHV